METEMTATKDDSRKPIFVLAGPTVGGPTLADLLAMFKLLTGRVPTPSDIERARRTLERE
jgi:hypothetical protein